MHRILNVAIVINASTDIDDAMLSNMAIGLDHGILQDHGSFADSNIVCKLSRRMNKGCKPVLNDLRHFVSHPVVANRYDNGAIRK